MLARAQKATHCAKDGGMGRERRQGADGARPGAREWGGGGVGGGIAKKGAGNRGSERERERERGFFHAEVCFQSASRAKTRAGHVRASSEV